ncbi:unnamed protein product [Schistocephalus solidus]|uniref:Uncharacterized protein n=1 Tax=Schistocephalus solidus TaxID=70667 RepID=A0A183T5Y9_SCHSO|nr:unnamed protein product [Schistocephalus solidus]
MSTRLMCAHSAHRLQNQPATVSVNNAWPGLAVASMRASKQARAHTQIHVRLQSCVQSAASRSRVKCRYNTLPARTGTMESAVCGCPHTLSHWSLCSTRAHFPSCVRSRCVRVTHCDDDDHDDDDSVDAAVCPGMIQVEKCVIKLSSASLD